MKATLWMLMLGLLLLCAQASEVVLLVDDEAVEHRLVAIAGELRCLVCQNEPLAGSRTELAQALRGEIRGLIQAGRTDDEILEFLLDRYGDFVRYQPPPVEPSTWLLWSAPMILLVAGLGAMTWHVRRRRHDSAPPAREDTAETVMLSGGTEPRGPEASDRQLAARASRRG